MGNYCRVVAKLSSKGKFEAGWVGAGAELLAGSAPMHATSGYLVDGSQYEGSSILWSEEAFARSFADWVPQETPWLLVPFRQIGEMALCLIRLAEMAGDPRGATNLAAPWPVFPLAGLEILKYRP